MWIEFQSRMRPFRVFSIRDVEKQFPAMNLMNLVHWQKKGYIIRLRNRWYVFSDTESHENIGWLAANLIYTPSYISLHTALSWYNLIPEMIVPVTSVTTKKTNRFSTQLGTFVYHRIKPEVYGLGTVLHDIDARKAANSKSRQVLVATPQKSILDLFYLNNFYDTEREMEELRLNETVLRDTVNNEFYKLLAKFGSKALEQRIRLMIRIYGL